MAVNLTTLVESLKNEVNPPGSNLYPTVTDAQWLSRLKDSFWEAKLNRAFTSYTLTGNSITPISGTSDIPRDQQQLIVLYAGFRIALTSFQNMNSSFRAKAGPVEYETQKSATTLKALLDVLRERIKQAVADGTGSSNGSLALVIDGFYERSVAIRSGDLFFVN